MVARRPDNVIILTGGLTGSSALAGLLSAAGFWSGEGTFRKRDYNTYENSELIRLNRQLMQRAGAGEEYTMRFLPEAVDRITALAGVEDPREYRAMVEEWGLVLTTAARALAAAFWPGPLTLVLPGGEGKLPDQLRGREGGIAVRYTSHTGIARLVAATGEPLTSPSANRPGDSPAPGADRIREAFADEVARGELLVLDGGVLGNVPPSTLVDCTSPVPRLVREGAIPRTELRLAAGRLAP